MSTRKADLEAKGKGEERGIVSDIGATLRLVYQGSTQPSLLPCLITAQLLGLPLELSTTPSDTHVHERPLLTPEPNVHIFSTFAICNYLLKTCPDKKAVERVLPVAAKDKIAELTAWCTSDLNTALASLQRKRVENALNRLQGILGNNDGQFLYAEDNPTLADAYVFSAIYGYDCMDIPEKLTAYLERVAKHPGIETALSQMPRQLRRLPDIADYSPFFITTAIHYTNGPPHIGHAYENIVTDVVQRYQRRLGRETYFSTGTDEHGQKIAQTAERQGVTPQELCNTLSLEFERLNKEFWISNDVFVRTTSEMHKQCCHKLWRRAMAKGDIYKGKYVGWYNVREEAFVTEQVAAETDYKDPVSGVPYTKMEEESYFFRLSKYTEALKQRLLENPEVVQPEHYRSDILAQLSEGLDDLSISRCTFKWGVQVPDDPDHVMYVWFDALTNYFTATHFQEEDELWRKFWPTAIHVVGKDIIRFHCIIWQAMLLSVDIVQSKVASHGFVVAADGKKMSKSLGNVVDPFELLNKYSSDSIRYYTMAVTNFGADVKFDEAALVSLHNSHLVETLGNLISRILALAQKFCDGKIPEEEAPDKAPFSTRDLRAQISHALKSFQVNDALESTIEATRATNKYLTDAAPWAIKDNPRYQKQVIRCILEAVYVLAHAFEPLIPEAAEKIFRRLAHPPRKLAELSIWYDNLTPNTALVGVSELLFTKIEPSKPEVQKTNPKDQNATKKGQNAKKGKGKKTADEANTSPTSSSVIDGAPT